MVEQKDEDMSKMGQEGLNPEPINRVAGANKGQKLLWIVGFLFLGILISLVLVDLAEHKHESNNDLPKPNLESPVMKTNRIVDINDDPIIGNKDVKLTIVEFGDFQCPFCAKHLLDGTQMSIMENYVHNGKAKFVYRDFPLQKIHLWAVQAAESADCVRVQSGVEGYFAMYEKLYGSQQQWQSQVDLVKVAEIFENLAMQSGVVNVTEYNRCVDQRDFQNEVGKDLFDALEYELTGTPTFFIFEEGKPAIMIVGAQPYEIFAVVLDSYLVK